MSCSQIPFCSISHDYANFSHVHVKWECLIFQLLFVISSISSSWFHFNYLQINSKSRSKPIALLFSLCIWIIINFICSLQFDSFLLSPIYQNHTLKWLQKFIKLVSNSCKGNNMLIECLGIITTQKMWNSWELLSKICSFWVVISVKRSECRAHHMWPFCLIIIIIIYLFKFQSFLYLVRKMCLPIQFVLKFYRGRQRCFLPPFFPTSLSLKTNMLIENQSMPYFLYQCIIQRKMLHFVTNIFKLIAIKFKT